MAKGDKKNHKTNAMRELERGGVSYSVKEYPCDGKNFDGELVARQVGLPAGQVFKTLVMQDEDGGYTVCCIPVNGRLNLKALAAARGVKRLEMIPADALQKVTGYIRGGCSPVGMKKAYPCFVDESALGWDSIAVSAGMRGLQALVPPGELIRYLNAKTGAFCTL